MDHHAAISREADVQLPSLLKTTQEIAMFLRMHEGKGELKIFYADLTAYCAIIRDHCNRISQAGHRIDASLRASMSQHLASVFTLPAGGFNELIRDWSEIHVDASKVDFVGRHVRFESTQDARNSFIHTLSEFESQLKSLYPDDPSQWVADGFFPSKKMREPSHAVWKAAKAILVALTACKACICTPNHEFSTRLCLGTFRVPECAPGIETDEDEVGFDMFLSMEKEWHEARIRVVRETTVRWQVGGSRDPGPEMKKRKPKPKQRVRQLCEPIAKMRALSSHRLELQVSSGGLFKLQSQRSTSPFDKTKDPLSLQSFLRGGPRSFTEKTRRILAVILSSAVLHLVDTRWLPSTWDSSDVVFLPAASSGIPLRPFLRTCIPNPVSPEVTSSSKGIDDDDDSASRISEDIDPDDLDPDDMMQHPCPALVSLAIMLLEVYFAATFDVLAARYGVTLADKLAAPRSAKYLDASLVFESCRGDIPENSQFHYAVERCLDPTVWEDDGGEPLDASTMRSTIYQYVAQPLEIELTQAYSSIPIHDLDRYAQALNFASWDQPILPQEHTHQGLSGDSGMATSFLSTPSSSPLSSCASPFSPPVPFPHQLFSQPPEIHYHLDVSRYSTLPGAMERRHSPLDQRAPRFFDDELATAAHPSEARLGYAAWKRKYTEVYDKFITAGCGCFSPVKIAILDTGIDLTHPDVMARPGNIKGRHNWVNQKARHVHDRNGHGTFAAGLILDFAPDAELYIAKIADDQPCSPATVAEAINHAVDTWAVDVISMSFGFPTCNVDGYSELEKALKTAYAKDVLLFAAASNNGGQLGRSFPAREPTVIAVHSTDANGNRSKFSPTPHRDGTNLATIGEAIESAWPVQLCEEDSNPECVQTKSGTSFATPILVGIAAFLLMYARANLPDKASAMKSQKRMEAVLKRVAEKGSGSAHQLRDGYHFVDVSLYTDSLFGRDKGFIDATLRDLLSH